MKYSGDFTDINNKKYTVVIVTNNNVQGETIPLKFGKIPFVTELVGDENVFKPVKYSNATINLITDKIYMDLYNSLAQNSKVYLMDSITNKVYWFGYLTPNIYNQNYNNPVEELSLEAICGLSTLQYIDYNSVLKKFTNFFLILVNLVRTCNCYQYLIFPVSLLEQTANIDFIYDKLLISDANFFDEDNKPMKCDEVLEEICLYLGLTCVALGDTVFFLDYESLARGNCGGFLCNAGGYILGKVNIRDMRPITKQFYNGNDTQINLGETYNKITVVDSLYSVDTVFPKLNDNKLLKNKAKDDFYELLQVVYPIDANLTYNAFMKFYTHPNFISYYYYKDAQGNILPNPSAQANNYYNLGDNIGGTIIKAFVNKEEEKGDVTKIPSLDWLTYIYVSNLGLHDSTVRKVISTKLDKEVAFNKDTYIILEGSVNFSSRDRYIPITDYEFGGDSFNKENLYIEGILKYGTKYYNGVNWQNTECPFKIYLNCEDNETSHLYNKNWDIKSNINYTMNLESTTGLAIRMPEDYFCTEVPEFSFIQPRHLITNKNNPEKLPYTGYWVSGFDMKLEIANFNSDDKEEDDSDTKYENVINEDYVNDFDEVEFKICTWDNKAPNYSAVVYNGPEGTKYLDYLFNMTVHDVGRPEELFINRMIRLYSSPPIIIDTITHNNVNVGTVFNYVIANKSRMFVVDGSEIDWKYDTCKLKLNEIK